jgi:hypothetical protein
VDLSLALVDWNCVLTDKSDMEGTFLDVVVRHVVFRANPEIRCQYHFASNWISCQLQLQLNDNAKTWDRIGAWLTKVLRSSTGSENTLVASYHDKGHWSLFVVDSSRTYHLDPLPGVHSSRHTKNFIFLLHLGWALAKGFRARQRPVGRYLEALSVRCPRALSEGELGMWFCCVHDVLAVHDGPRVAVGGGRERRIREEELAALGWHHAPEVGVASIIHRDSVPAS